MKTYTRCTPLLLDSPAKLPQSTLNVTYKLAVVNGIMKVVPGSIISTGDISRRVMSNLVRIIITARY